MATGVTIDVKPKTIQVVADDLVTGKYYLPSFQRQYVWDEDDIKDLLESIFRNYPIGTVILWNPKGNSGDSIDPFSKPLMLLHQLRLQLPAQPVPKIVQQGAEYIAELKPL